MLNKKEISFAFDCTMGEALGAPTSPYSGRGLSFSVRLQDSKYQNQ